MANTISRVRAAAEAQGQIPVSGQTVPPPQGDSVEKGARALTPWRKGLWGLGSGTAPGRSGHGPPSDPRILQKLSRCSLTVHAEGRPS